MSLTWAMRRRGGPIAALLPRWRWFAQPNGMAVIAAVPAAAIVGLLLVVGWISVQESVVDATFTVRHYVSLYTDPFAYRTFLNTIGFTATTLIVALLIGVPMAWLVTRTDVPGKPLLLTAMTLGVLMPGYFTAMSWLLMFHPRIGLVNQAARQLFGAQTPAINVVSVPGMGIVQGLNLAALVFVLVAGSLRSLDPALEEAAQTSGGSFLITLRRVTAPLAFPGLLAAALYVLTIGIGAFDVPAIIGLSNRIFTFSTYLYTQVHPNGQLPDYGQPAAFSSFMVLLALLLSWGYSRVLLQARRYQVVTGKNYRPRQLPLGRWAMPAWLFLGGYLLLAQILPLLLLVWAALLPFVQMPSADALASVSLKNFTVLPWSQVGRGVEHTVVLAVLAPTLALALSLTFSWVVLRSRSRFRLVYDFVAFLPHAVPSIVFGLGGLLISLFIGAGMFDLYGSLTLLLLMYTITHISFGTRITNGGLINVHAELEEAAHVSGATAAVTLRRIIVPLLRPALLYGWLWLALLTIRELPLATMLFSARNVTLSVVVWSLWNGGQLGQGAAVSILMMALLLPLVVVYWRLGGASRAGF